MRLSEHLTYCIGIKALLSSTTPYLVRRRSNDASRQKTLKVAKTRSVQGRECKGENERVRIFYEWEDECRASGRQGRRWLAAESYFARVTRATATGTDDEFQSSPIYKRCWAICSQKGPSGRTLTQKLGGYKWIVSMERRHRR